MHILIRDFGQHSSEFVDVLNDDLSRRFVLRPFETASVDDAIESTGQLFCLAHSQYDSEQKVYSTELAVFDSETGRELKRTMLPFHAYTVAHLPKNGLLAVQFMNRCLHFLDAETLDVVWQKQPLFVPVFDGEWPPNWVSNAPAYKEISGETRAGPPGCAFVWERLFERDDGKILGLAATDWGDQREHDFLGTSAGYFSFDVPAKECTFHPIEFSPWGAKQLFAPSPDGRFAVRISPQCDLGPRHITGKESDAAVWLLHRQKLDIWSLDDQTPVRRVDMSDVPFRRYAGLENIEQVEQRLRDLAMWSCCGSDAFRLPHTMPPGARSLHDGDVATKRLREIYGDRGMMPEIIWEANGEAFWVYRKNSLRRIAVDGKRGPLLVFERYLSDEQRAILDERIAGTDIGFGEAHPAISIPLIKSLRTTETEVEIGFYGDGIRFNKGLAMSDEALVLMTDEMITAFRAPDLSAADVASLLPGVIHIESWNKEDLTEGLRRLTKTLRQDIFSLMADGITLVFNVGADFLDEKQFIDELSEKQIDVVHEMKEVIDTWCVALRKNSLVFSGNQDGAGPFAYVLEYIAERDDACFDQLRNYCLLRGGEHEQYSRDTVLKGYLMRQGLVSTDLWSLAILHLLLFGRDGACMVSDGQMVSDWVHTGVLDEARKQLEPQEFAQLVLQELMAFETCPDVFASFGTHAEASSSAKEDLLRQLKDVPWDVALKSALTA